MLYRVQLHLLIVVLLAAGAVAAQSAEAKPVTKSDVFAALEAGKSSEELLKKANLDLVAAINGRGVDFVLTPEEEWQLGMRDASEELLAAIREAVDPKEREERINASRQERLYNEFAGNYNASHLAGRQSALRAAREFVQLYADDQNVAEIVTFMQRNLPRLEQSVTVLAQREEAMERVRAQARESQQQDGERRGRRRQETPEETAAREEYRRRRTPNAPVNASETKIETPVVRQPSDPVPVPQYPVGHRP